MDRTYSGATVEAQLVILCDSVLYKIGLCALFLGKYLKVLSVGKIHDLFYIVYHDNRLYHGAKTGLVPSAMVLK